MKFSLLVLCGLIAVSCGVRGKPQPPLEPAQIGRGQPTMKRVTEEYAFPDVPSPDATPEPERRSGENQ